MEHLTRLSRSALLLVAGAVFVVAGIADRFSLASLSVEVAAWWQRSVLVGLGIVCTLAAAYFGMPGRAGDLRALQPESANGLGLPRADTFLFTLDDGRPDLTFPAVVDGAATISLMARTSVNLLSNYRNTLVNLMRSGVQLRLLIVDPSCAAAVNIYGRDAKVYRQNVGQLCANLMALAEDLKRGNVGSAKLSLRLISEVPPFSMLLVEKREPARSVINIQISFLRTRISRDRPTFVIHRQDTWYDHFMYEFEHLWEDHSIASSIPDLVSRAGGTGGHHD